MKLKTKVHKFIFFASLINSTMSVSKKKTKKIPKPKRRERQKKFKFTSEELDEMARAFIRTQEMESAIIDSIEPHKGDFQIS